MFSKALFLSLFLILSSACALGTRNADAQAKNTDSKESDAAKGAPAEELSPEAQSSLKAKPKKAKKNKVVAPEVAKASEPPQSLFDEVVRRYQTSIAVKMDVKKKLHQELLGRTVESDGQLEISRGRMRAEFKGEDHTLIVFDGKTLWAVTYLPKDFGGGVQVAKMAIEVEGKSQTVLASLFRLERLKQEFKISEAKGKLEETKAEYDLSPKAKDGDVKKMKMILNKDLKQIEQIEIVDQIDNKTLYVFENPKFGAELKASRFSYVPPKGAEITEYN
jgi:outer membrane lipoprotein carrier protein